MTTSIYKREFESNYNPSRPMTEPSVLIPAHVYAKIMTWIDEAPGEVSGLGKVTHKDGVFTVKEVYLLKQKNSGASTEIDAQEVAKLLYETREVEGHLNFWWHSHVNMGCFWSGTDITTIQEMGQHGWLLSTVLNKKRESLSALYIKSTDILPEVFIDQIETTIGQPFYSDRDKWIEEYQEKCKVVVPAYPTSGVDWKDRFDDWKQTDLCDSFAPKGGIHSRPIPTINPLHLVSLNNIEEYIEDAETEPDEKLAKGLLYTAIAELNRHAGITKKERKSLKKEYIERFNLSRLEHKERQGASQ